MFGDDYLMNYIANGSFGSTYSAHLVFIRYPAGLMLKGLFRLFPSVNWYAVMLIGTLALSCAVFHYCILTVTRHPAAIAVSLLINAAAVPLFLTFTVAAFFAIAAGLVLILTGIREKRSFRFLIPGVLLMLAGYLIRDDCLLPSLAIAFPSYLSLLIKAKERKKLFRQAAALLLILAAGLFAAEAVEKQAYSSKAWQSYQDFNDARGDILDYPAVAYDAHRAEFEEAGYPLEAWILMSRWTFCEKQVFSPERMRRVAEIMQSEYGERYRLRYMIDTFSTPVNALVLLIPACVFLLLMLTDPHFRKRTGFFTVCMYVFVLSGLCFLRLRFLLRVSCPLGIITLVFLFLCSSGRNDPESEHGLLLPKKTRRIILFAGSLLLLVVLGFFLKGYLASVSGLRSTSTASGYRKLRKEIDAHPDRTYVVESPIYVWLFIYGHPVSEIKYSDTFSHVIRAGSWDNFSPRYYDAARANGVKDPDNLLSSLVGSDSLYLVTENTDFVTNFLTAATGTTCEVLSSKKKGPATIAKIGQSRSSS